MADAGAAAGAGSLSSGVLSVARNAAGLPVVHPADSGEVAPGDDLLQVVYDHGPVEGLVWDDFDTVRQRVEREWAALPPTADNISSNLREKVKQQVEEHRGKMAAGKAAEAT